MKKIILTGCIAAFTFLGGNVNAQTYAEVEKPADATPWSIETLIAINNNDGIKWNSPALRARFFFNDKIALRLQLGIGDGSGLAMAETNNFDEAGGDGVGVQKINRTALNIQIGAEYHFIGTQKLDPYAALGITFGMGSQKVEGNMVDPNFGSPVYNEFVSYDGKGGYGVFGASLALGADFYFVENVYLGLELGLGFGTRNAKESESNSTVTMGGSTVTTSSTTSGNKRAYLGTQAMFRLGWRF